jgi:hypothetical protein
MAANRTSKITGMANTVHDGCSPATMLGVDTSAGSPGTETPRSVVPGVKSVFPGRFSV